MNKLRMYYAGSIRGPQGDNVPPSLHAQRIEDGIKGKQRLQHILDRHIAIKEIEWSILCPHEYEDVFLGAWTAGLITSAQIIDFWCNMIARTCDIICLSTDPQESQGVGQELVAAQKHGLYVWELYKYPADQWEDYIWTQIPGLWQLYLPHAI